MTETRPARSHVEVQNIQPYVVVICGPAPEAATRFKADFNARPVTW